MMINYTTCTLLYVPFQCICVVAIIVAESSADAPSLLKKLYFC